MQKNILAIHDISCVGRCSLTVALPILSASGLQTSVLPTAVLSTHTGGFSGYTYRDLTCDIMPIMNHWDKLSLQFDAMYSGFLGSYEQIDLVKQLFGKFGKDGLILVDPVMGDNGVLYSTYDDKMIEGMARLCASADIIVPNLTEACFLLGVDFPSSYDRAYIEDIVRRLSLMCAGKVVVTGISFASGELGAVCYDSSEDIVHYVHNSMVGGYYHGTGDIFGSALLSAIMYGHDLVSSTQIAVDYVLECIRLCVIEGKDQKYGVPFELAIPSLIDMLRR